MSRGEAGNSAKLTAEDKTNLKELAILKKKITKDIETFKFHDAAYDLYHYIWHTFADKIIENYKPRLLGTNREDQEAALQTLTAIFTDILKMLHPFMPFVTEALWSHFHETPLIIENW